MSICETMLSILILSDTHLLHIYNNANINLFTYNNAIILDQMYVTNAIHICKYYENCVLFLLYIT